MTTNAPTTISKLSMNIKKVLGSSPSMVLMSSENLFTMRPVGVVSKKDMGERTILCSILWWSEREAMMVRYTNISCISTIRAAEKGSTLFQFFILIGTQTISRKIWIVIQDWLRECLEFHFEKLVNELLNKPWQFNRRPFK